MRVADRIDPFAGVSRAVEPVRVRRRHLDHALNRADGERGGARGEVSPQMPLRLRHAHEPRLEHRQEGVRGEAPVAETHDPGADADRDLVPLAEVRLCRLVVPAVLHEPTHDDPADDERDVEDEQADRGEPERALGEPVARERTATIRGSAYHVSPVAMSVPPPTIITCVFERSRTRCPA